MVGLSALLVGFGLSTTSANAACAPDPATSGQTVTCSGVVAGGFEAGAGVNNLTVNVVAGATVNDNGTASIGVNDSNTVTNAGTLAPAAGLIGINAGNLNTIVNSGSMNVGDLGTGIAALNANTIKNSGTITAGASGVAISVFDNNVVTNTGTLAVGTFGSGIFAGVNNTITNAATGIITVVDNGPGIFVAGNSAVTNDGSVTVGASGGGFAGGIVAINDFNTVTNSAGARINVGSGVAGIIAQGNDATVSNAGSITTVDTPALFVQGDRAVITNSGTLTTGNTSAGMVYNGFSSTVTNSGHIVGGDDTVGMIVLGDSITVTNSGTITVGNGVATGIDITSLFGSNTIINTGTINVGVGGTGILVNGPGNVFNSGTINAATGFAAIEFCGCGIGNTLTLGPGSAIYGLVLGTGTDTFQLGGSGKDTFNLSLIGPGNQYDGFSTFNKIGSSNWTVTGTGSQDWNVLEGTLSVNGVINGVVTVNAGGTLGGTGTVGNTTINGGALAPGNSIGTLTVAGSLVFTAAASYMVEVSPTTADRTNVTGTATLGSATVNVSFEPGNYVARQYTILNAAGGINGTFNPVVGNVAPNFKTTLSYDASNVYLNLALSFTSGLTPNQQNVANALTNAFNSGSGVPVAVGSLTSAGLTQISGELATGSQQSTFDAMNIFLGLLTDPFIAGRSGGASVGGSSATPFTDESGSYAYAAKRQGTARDAFAKFPTKADVARNDLFDQRWSVWGSAFGGGSNSDGNANVGSNNAAVRAFGLAAGADYRISPSTLVGFALAGGGTNFNVNGSGYGRSDLFQAGAFVRHNVGAAYVTAAAVYGWQDVTTDRTVTVAGVDRLRAEFNANAWSGRVEGGYRYVTPWMGITPYAAGQFTTYQLPAYAEQVLSGSNAFALNYAAKDVTTGRSELGVRLDRSFAMQNAVLTLRGRAAWAHNFNTDRSITALFQSVPGATFLVSGAAQAPNTALTTASAEMKWLNGWSAAATFEGEFSDITRSYAGKGVIRYTW
nr:autotransporter domain-containing protein [Bradyrhizobium sp. JYMT SZCCT0180]